MFNYHYVLAVGVGLLFSLPFGPMGILACNLWLQGYKRAATAIVGGVCLGDILVGITVLTSLKLATTVDIPSPFKALVLVLIACLLWREAGRGRHGMPLRSIWRYGAFALGLTLAQPTNWGIYWGIYGLGTGYLTDVLGNWLPLWLADLTPASRLGVGELMLVLVFQLLGMVLGWAGYAVFLSAISRGFVKIRPHRHRPKAAQRNYTLWVGRGASLIVFSGAMVIMVQSLELLA